MSCNTRYDIIVDLLDCLQSIFKKPALQNLSCSNVNVNGGDVIPKISGLDASTRDELLRRIAYETTDEIIETLAEKFNKYLPGGEERSSRSISVSVS
jgi:hypothetical protein